MWSEQRDLLRHRPACLSLGRANAGDRDRERARGREAGSTPLSVRLLSHWQIREQHAKEKPVFCVALASGLPRAANRASGDDGNGASCCWPDQSNNAARPTRSRSGAAGLGAVWPRRRSLPLTFSAGRLLWRRRNAGPLGFGSAMLLVGGSSTGTGQGHGKAEQSRGVAMEWRVQRSMLTSKRPLDCHRHYGDEQQEKARATGSTGGAVAVAFRRPQRTQNKRQAAMRKRRKKFASSDQNIRTLKSPEAFAKLAGAS